MIDKYMKTKLGDVQAYIFTAKVKDILPIYYVAVRGRNDVKGAVQRVLNRRRINSIKDFILDCNMFFNTFILNWTDTNYSLIVDDSFIKIPIVNGGAQVIDGQHRLEGLKRAVDERDEVGEESIIIIMTEKMSTQAAARIFLTLIQSRNLYQRVWYMIYLGSLLNKQQYLIYSIWMI